MEVRNCKQCGRLFNYIGNNVCPRCLSEGEDAFVKVKTYVRENPSAGVAEVAEATETSLRQIHQWIREERLILSKADVGQGINCESCGKPIQTGRMCAACKQQMKRDLGDAMSLYVKKEPAAASKQEGTHKNKMRYLNETKKN